MNQLLFFGLFVYINIVVLSAFYCIGKIFETQKEVAESEWLKMGKPILRFSTNPNNIKFKFPANMIILQYVWMFSTPDWAKGNSRLSKLFVIYRVISVFSLVGALGVLYFMFGILNIPLPI